MGVVDRRRSHDSDLSHTSNEAETESATNALSRAICRLFLQVTDLDNKSPPSWDFVSRHENMPITILRSIQGNVKNDGAILHINQCPRCERLIMKRSKIFDLIEQSDRREFARCFIGLLLYKSATVTHDLGCFIRFPHSITGILGLYITQNVCAIIAVPTLTLSVMSIISYERLANYKAKLALILDCESFNRNKKKYHKETN
ncbi:hypothetical protein CONCODRAFT_9770 [Conidiobolus coronatus NRRL 28638]|uniref:Uncharacterized protein n=1 Tax=Conidiobolus coronatus (strain ATCC 28846 / CBS 209.66 / NRRL 28638) TaxID=796925 RepID=A0A137NZ00_CONC2|nr:hypothetical protein CONCODRAFT_9770 [Conidiobolus coronatus NRRL 28638]|eukprot:KXN68045.1 hypothetical protein CONCODRAFT_9770 [Conidiobolus coronatus NRRL 28638]